MSLAIQINEDYETWEMCKESIKNAFKKNNLTSNASSVMFARSFCFGVCRHIWSSVDVADKWPLLFPVDDILDLDYMSVYLAREISLYLKTKTVMECAYCLGELYTMLLPKDYRAANGIYYTPPLLAERLLDVLSAEGADWYESRFLDPACGGGAFLLTIASRMLGDFRVNSLSAEEKLSHLENHLFGYELDQFAGWLTQMLLDMLVYKEAVLAKRKLKSVVETRDTIQWALCENKEFDVIVGNPPFGRVKLDEKTRNAYSRSLYGHANLYGLFIDAALRLRAAAGLIGFVTPTSFLGGNYYTSLRKLIMETAPPLNIDFVDLRSGVFDQVLQETCLVVFGRNHENTARVNRISICGNHCKIEKVGNFYADYGSSPWLIPREASESKLIKIARRPHATLRDYGYKISTGQLVWNRFKDQIQNTETIGAQPIVWAEAIQRAGEFSFDYRYRNDLKYIMIKKGQEFLVTSSSAVLLPRTTSKEQQRRLRASILPQSFIDKWGGVVVENHVNLTVPISESPVPVEILCHILNTKIVDRLFRCLSGSVAVSAAELHSLPLPPLEVVETIKNILKNNADKEAITSLVEIAVDNSIRSEEAAYEKRMA